MVTKIRIKLGIVEIEYEGDENFFKEELPQILTEISRLAKETGIDIASDCLNPSSEHALPEKTNNNIIGTTSTIAAKIGGSSGQELIIAAAARITFVEQNDTFTRERLIAEMKTAPAYFKPSYVNNLSRYLSKLIKSGKIIEIKANTYTLAAKTRTELENRLA